MYDECLKVEYQIYLMNLTKLTVYDKSVNILHLHLSHSYQKNNCYALSQKFKLFFSAWAPQIARV